MGVSSAIRLAVIRMAYLLVEAGLRPAIPRRNA